MIVFRAVVLSGLFLLSNTPKNPFGPCVSNASDVESDAPRARAADNSAESPESPFAPFLAEALARRAELLAKLPQIEGDGALEMPEPSAAMLRSLELGYLTSEERADRRVFHGLWTDSDLEDPARMAQAALISGVWDHPALDDERARLEDRAEARVLRGDLEEALGLLAVTDSVRAARLRIQALEGLGRYDESLREAEEVLAQIKPETSGSAEEVTESVRILIIRARLVGEPSSGFERMMRLLSRAHQELDRLYWPARLVEGELLIARSNAQEGLDSVLSVLTMHPRCGPAIALLGEWSVRTFDYGRAEVIARRLDQMHNRIAETAGAVRARTSPWGDMVRAYGRLRQSDPDLAEAHLVGTIERFPGMRSALARWCGVASARFDEERMEAMLAAYDAVSPGSADAMFAMGETLSFARQYDHAAAMLRRAIERSPNWAEAWTELGLVLMQRGDDVGARDALRVATRLDPFHTRAGNSLKIVDELLAYETVESEHFTIRYRPGVDGVLAREMAGQLDAMHEVVTEAMRHSPRERTIVELMPDHEWFSVRIAGVTATHTIAAATGPVIAMEAPRIGKKHSGWYDWLRVVRHEYAHTVTLDQTDNRIPHWFTEAAAVHMELAPRDYQRSQMLAHHLLTDDLFDFETINVGFIRPFRPVDRPLAYAQAEWIWEFMVDRFGSHTPIEMMEQYRLGVREREAIPRVFGMSPEQFLAEFAAWAREDVRSWGMLPSPSLDRLRLDETLADPVFAERAERAVASWSADVAMRAVGGGHTMMREQPQIELVRVTPEVVDFWRAAYPEHPDVLLLAVEEEMRQTGGKVDAPLAELLEQYAAARPVDDMPRRLLAQWYLGSETPERAIPHLEFLDAREIRSPVYAAELARRYAAIGDFKRALEKAERALVIAPFDGNLRELAAGVAVQKRAWERAEWHLLALVEMEPQRADRHQRRLEALRGMMR